MLDRRYAEAPSACLRPDDVSQLPPRYARVLGSRNLSALRSEQRAARAAARQRHGEVISSGNELVGRIFYAVLTTSRNHATRCMTIRRTWGARLPREHLVFYSDKAETRLQELNVVPLADPNLAPSAVYADAQDRFTYRIMPDVVRRMRALNMSWLLWADDDTFVWPENLQRLLAPYDSSRWSWLGQLCGPLRGRRAFCGGAGFAMSYALARVAGCVAPLCAPYKKTETPYDRRMGVCFDDLLHVRVADVPEFNSQPPHFYMTADGRRDRPTGYGAAVTFHYLKTDPRPVSPEEHYRALWAVTRAAYPPPHNGRENGTDDARRSADGATRAGGERLAGIGKGRGWSSGSDVAQWAALFNTANGGGNQAHHGNDVDAANKQLTRRRQAGRPVENRQTLIADRRTSTRQIGRQADRRPRQIGRQAGGEKKGRQAGRQTGILAAMRKSIFGG